MFEAPGPTLEMRVSVTRVQTWSRWLKICAGRPSAIGLSCWASTCLQIRNYLTGFTRRNVSIIPGWPMFWQMATRCLINLCHHGLMDCWDPVCSRLPFEAAMPSSAFQPPALAEAASMV